MEYIAVQGICNTFGIGITEINTVEDTVTFAWTNDLYAVTTDLHYDEEDVYFLIGDIKMYLKDFMKL